MSDAATGAAAAPSDAPAAPPAAAAPAKAAAPSKAAESADITAAKLLISLLQLALVLGLFYAAAKEAYRIRLYAIEVRG